MTDIPGKCIKRHRNPLFPVSEGRSRVDFENGNRFEVQEIQVDSCVFKTVERIRCDFLVNVSEADVSVLVELKGAELEHAHAQLEETHKRLKPSLLAKKHWIISYSGSPRFDATIQDKKRLARKKYKSTLIIRRSPYLF